MPARKPTECPACGHERIARRTNALLFSPESRPRPARLEWVCQLCQYVWEHRTFQVVDRWEIA